MQTYKNTFYEWDLHIFGYYRCSWCRGLNTFTVKLFKSSVTSGFRFGKEIHALKTEKLARQRQHLMENADKGIYYMPYVFSGRCANCGEREPWQKTMNRPLSLMTYAVPVTLVILCYATGVSLWKLAAALGSWAVLKLLEFLAARSASRRCRDIDEDCRPHFFRSGREMEDALRQACPNETYTENKKVFGAPFI